MRFRIFFLTFFQKHAITLSRCLLLHILTPPPLKKKEKFKKVQNINNIQCSATIEIEIENYL